MAKRVADAMTPRVATIEPSQTVVEAARAMKDQDVGSLPVVEDGMLIGIVTDRDIAMRVVAEGREGNASTIGEILSGELVTIALDQSLDEAIELMELHQVRRLPVVEDDGRLVGMITQADVALEAKEKKAGELLQEVSQPSFKPRS
jgi:CBS domain-containing protein